MRSLRCSEMRSNLDHLDGQLARRPFFINLLSPWPEAKCAVRFAHADAERYDQSGRARQLDGGIGVSPRLEPKNLGSDLHGSPSHGFRFGGRPDLDAASGDVR